MLLFQPFKSFAFSIILFGFLATSLHANVKTPPNTPEACQKLIDDAGNDLKENKYPDALEKLLEAELMAQQNQWNDKLWDIKTRIGSIYYYTSGFGEALSYYQEALSIIQKNKKLHEKSFSPLNSIAVLYGREGKYLTSIEYYEKAFEIIKNKKGLFKKDGCQQYGRCLYKDRPGKKSFRTLK